jgi:hypothetical protein
MSTIVVAGAVANQPHNGGGVWEKMSWVAGLRRLGCDVWFVEQIAPKACVDDRGGPATLEKSANLAWFRSVMAWFGLADRSALVGADNQESHGVAWPELVRIAWAADLLVNISGNLRLDSLMRRFRRKAFIDVDPGFTQSWLASTETGYTVAGHDWYFTIGENIGAPDCPIPTGGIPWRLIRQPVVLTDWPVAATEKRGRFTTVGSWRGLYGPVQYAGHTYGLKVHEFRKFASLPRLLGGDDGPWFEAALDIHPADAKDLAMLRENGWRIIDPRTVAATPAAFRAYVQASAAEWSVAQGAYVETNSGWFSDRTVRYLASGKPALVQDTGFSRRYPVGMGLVPFRTIQEAIAGAEDIMRNYDAHCQAARAIAVNYFDASKVLGQFLDEIGITP